ncbi:MAG: metalloregulator ArsR/SmtB family transcription factor [Acidobacteria bacterium]|nr:metalloregulator ArsR/SmtB family transcription factor [Acidobacteriota bacterium]
MEQGTMVEELLAFFKALSDANRLKIVALLAQQPRSVEQLAGMLGVSSSTVSHHLARLSKVGLVSARAEGYYSMYRLEPQALSEMAERVLSKDALPAVAADVDGDAYDRKVLATYLTSEGRLRAFPVQRKKEEATLRHVAKAFAKGRRYTEKQVNGMLSRFNEDYARLRRNLVDFGFMQREGGGGEYWLLS